MTFDCKVPIVYANSRVALCRLSAKHRGEYIECVIGSAEHLFPWVRLPVTLEEFDKYSTRFDGKTAECALICDRDSGKIVGAVDITQIIRGPHQRATVGYYSFIPWVRKGYMSEGFPLIFHLAFKDLGLHRLEADIQPENKPSLRFAEKVGFHREGYSPGFIRIGGEWRDHERWAITSDMVAMG
jgi:ribosomal-protein-alanine N-acetyltransferase